MIPSTSIARSAATCALLAEIGYRVSFREYTWSECWIRGEGERWIGHGKSGDEALEHALEQMLPSWFAQDLLARHLDATPHADVVPAALVVTDTALPSEPAAVPAPKEAPPAPPAQTEADAAEADSAPASVERRRVGEAKNSEAARHAARAALDAIEKVRVEIDRDVPRLARLAPDRQRLEILVWICRARALGEPVGGDREVPLAVARIARRLTELAKMFWPGSILALQLTTTPAETMETRAARTAPLTWADAEASARVRLGTERARGAAIGYDEDGWADAALLKPVAPNPDELLEQAIAELDLRLSPRRARSQERADLDALLTIARTLRWIRGSVTDHLAWGTAVGRLRRHVLAIEDGTASRLRDILDPRTRPSSPWSKLVLGNGGAPAPKEPEAPAGPSEAELRAELRAELPNATGTPDALLAWLVRAFDVLSTPDLRELLAPVQEQLLEVGKLAADHEDRRVRRRLRDLLARPGDDTPDEEDTPTEADAPPPSPTDEQDEDDTSPGITFETLLDRVRPITKGRRVLFVSNRLDPELEARLTDMLEIDFTGCEGSLRRVQAQCTRIAKGSYDLVMSATGFQHHGVDGALARAAGAAKVPYVRVDRGRPLTCLRALARDFGLLDG